MLDSEREYLLERCLRLEAQVAMLQGHAIEPLPPIERQISPDPLPSVTLLRPTRRITRAATSDEITHMRALRRSGLCFDEIARRMARSTWTVRKYTKDVQAEQAVLL